MKLDATSLTPEVVAGAITQSAPDACETLAAIAGDTRSRLAEIGIEAVDGAEFLAQKKNIPPWIVENFIGLHMKGDLCGGAKTKKSYLVIELGVCVATGRDFLDVYKINTPHTVAYFNLELFEWNAQERINAICDGLGIDGEALRSRLHLFNLRGKAEKLREDGVVQLLITRLEELGIELVIIDPRYKLLKAGEDENTGDGLRGILNLRDELAAHFATLLVTHDPKGDTAQKKTTDRGAGSYTAGADFDFRLTIDKGENFDDDNLVYVVEAEGRARKAPPKIGVRFDDTTQTFRHDDKLSTQKLDGRNGGKNGDAAKAARSKAKIEAYAAKAVEIVEEAGAKLLSITQFDERMDATTDGHLGVNKRGPARKNLIRENILKTTPELERKADGTIGKRKNGDTLISTPSLINAYLAKFGGPSL